MSDPFNERYSRQQVGRTVVSDRVFRERLAQSQNAAYDTGIDMEQMQVPDEEHEDITPGQREFRRQLKEQIQRNGGNGY